MTEKGHGNEVYCYCLPSLVEPCSEVIVVGFNLKYVLWFVHLVNKVTVSAC